MKLFRNPWLRIWILFSLCWVTCFNVWSYYKWEKVKDTTVFLIQSELASGLMTEKEAEWETIKYKGYWWWDNSFRGKFQSYFVDSYLEKNMAWYALWCFGPVVFCLLFILCTGWVVAGFRKNVG